MVKKLAESHPASELENIMDHVLRELIVLGQGIH